MARRTCQLWATRKHPHEYYRLREDYVKLDPRPFRWRNHWELRERYGLRKRDTPIHWKPH